MDYTYILASWGSPIALGFFFVLGSIAFYFFSNAIKNLQNLKK